MKKIHYLGTIIGWVVLIVLALVTMPNINQLVQAKGQITLPEDAQSQLAARIDAKANDNKKLAEVIVVFNQDKPLTAAQNTAIDQKLVVLKKNMSKYHIISMITADENAYTKKQLVSKDSTTQLATLEVENDEQITQNVAKIRQQLNVSRVQTYTTGVQILENEFIAETESGVQTTTIIAVIFILIVLIIIFRSPIVPLVVLSTVGISVLVALNIIMNLAKYLNFPISNFTEIFLIVVVFGIGTDYNILLYDHFKKALLDGQDPLTTAKTVRRKAGRTVLYSGSSVLIGFSVLGLSNFSLYRSAVGVAIGIAVLLSNLLTYNIFFMANFGEKLFWPSKIKTKRADNRLWKTLSSSALMRPFLMVGLFLIVCLPFLLLYPKMLNYDNAVEVQDSEPGKAGYVAIQKHFSKGMTGPGTLYIESDRPFVNQEDLAALDEMTDYLKAEDGVADVYSVTQPGGEQIDELYLRSQLKTLISGVDEAQSALTKIKYGLSSASNQLVAADIDGQLQKVQELANGAQELDRGAQEFNSGLTQYTQGIATLTGRFSDLSDSTQRLSTGVNEVSQKVDQATGKINQFVGPNQKLLAFNQQLIQAIQENPELEKVVKKVGINMEALNLIPDLYLQADQQFNQLNNALHEIDTKVPELQRGIQEMQQGGTALDTASGKLTSSYTTLVDGIRSANQGIQELATKLQAMSGKVKELITGLKAAGNGLDEIKSGVGRLTDYMDELQPSYIGNSFYIPKAQLNNGQLKESYDAFLMGNQKVATLTVVFVGEPSDSTTVDVFRRVKRDLEARLKGTTLSDSTVAIGGQTAQSSDLESIVNANFIRTAIIMLIGILIALMVVTRSILYPVTVIATLIGAYLISMGVTNGLSGVLTVSDTLAWPTPFFTFIMLISLGVDYSIFLMRKYQDERMNNHLSAQEGIKAACAQMGLVVLSAGFILSGTFASMIPSGLPTLVQVAVGVDVGIIVLVISLPLTLSAAVKWIGK